MNRENNLAMFRPLLAVTGTLLLLTAVAYPLAITGSGQVAFNRQANGSMISVGGREVGSSLVGQVFAGTSTSRGGPRRRALGTTVHPRAARTSVRPVPS